LNKLRNVLLALGKVPVGSRTNEIIIMILWLTGAQIMSVFGVSPKPTIKYQMGIPNKWREERRDKILVAVRRSRLSASGRSGFIGESVWRSS